MPSELGRRLGPYEVRALLGAGGMGEVYRGRDTRLGRDLAIKVVRADLGQTPERLRRFEQEARLTGSLSHPNLVSLFDIGTHEGRPFLVMELLEGASLKERIEAGPLPPRKAVEYARQAARGLAAAHEKGVVHCDLKPGNIFVTRDGRIKILDFGLAKLTQVEMDTAAGSEASTHSREGGRAGTVGYMAPEQVRGLRVDARADIFAFGAILYEMLSGRRAFEGDSAADTITAVLTKDPPELVGPRLAVPVALQQFVRRCLEKDVGQRFQSTWDLACTLEALLATPASGYEPLPPAQRRRRGALMLGAVAALAIVAATHVGAFFWGATRGQGSIPRFTRMTFRRGHVVDARFAGDSQTAIYSAAWDGGQAETYSLRLPTTDARPFGIPGWRVQAIAGGEAALLRNGTLARLPIEGGTMREVAANVAGADWTPDAQRFAIVRDVEDQQRLEYPIGRVLCETRGLERLGRPRLSPKGDLIAFDDYPSGVTTQTGGRIAIIDMTGRRRDLSTGWSELEGLAWSADGREVWFTGAKVGLTQALYAVTLSGDERLLLRTPQRLRLLDIARDGRLLVEHGQQRTEMWGRMAGDEVDRDLSWLGTTITTIIDRDGTRMVFQELEGRGPTTHAIYLRRNDGSAPVRLGDGTPLDVSPDWRWVLSTTWPSERLSLIPVGTGEPKAVPRGSIDRYQWAVFHPDGRRLVLLAHEAGRPLRLFIQDLPNGLPRPFSPEGVSQFWGLLTSPDGRYVSVRPPHPTAPYVLFPIDGGPPRAVPGLTVRDEPCYWTEDGRQLVVWENRGEVIPARIVQLDVATGRRQPLKEFAPRDPTGVESGIFPWFSWPISDGRYYAYSYGRTLSDLFLVEGVR